MFDPKKRFMVGLFVVLTISGLLVISLVIGDVEIFEKGREIRIRFDTAAGLEPGEDVTVSGVKVGEIKDIVLDKDGVLVVGRVYRDFVLHEDYSILIKDKSIIGGRYISIDPGSRKKPIYRWKESDIPLKGGHYIDTINIAGRILDENRLLISSLVNRLDGIAGTISDLLEEVKRGQGSLGKLLKEEDAYRYIITTLKNLVGITSQLNRTGKVLSDKLESQKSLLNAIISDEELYEKFRDSIERLNELVRGLESTNSLVGRLVNDPSLSESLNLAMDNLLDSTNKLNRVVTHIEEGKGLIGKLIKDEAAYADLKSSLEVAREYLSPLGRLRLFLGGEASYFAGKGLLVSSPYIRLIPSKRKYFIVGLSLLHLNRKGKIDYPEKNTQIPEDATRIFPRLIVGWNWFDGLFTTKLGLFEGRFGGGLDFRFDLLDRRITLGMEGRFSYNDRDLDSVKINENTGPFQLRAYLRVPLWRKLVLKGGVDDFTGLPAFWGGLSYEYRDEDIRSIIGLLGFYSY